METKLPLTGLRPVPCSAPELASCASLPSFVLPATHTTESQTELAGHSLPTTMAIPQCPRAMFP